MSPFDPASLQAQLKDYQTQMEAPTFWDDVEQAQKVNQKAKQLSERIAGFESLKSAVDDALELAQLAEAENDAALAEDIFEDAKSLAKRVEHLRLSTLLKGEYDNHNAILALHAGAGGTEAQDWVSMLYRMYTRYAESAGYRIKLLDMLPGEEAGIKSVSFLVEGENAYGYLKAEKGV
ncbi:PCRF domain-containing protein, partial [Eubacteriales bacterium OttesenSCG-928-N14]|nr:PCRF domain-containing protein [Eubacteriales bacterium OttesenSCG-928-N14]